MPRAPSTPAALAALTGSDGNEPVVTTDALAKIDRAGRGLRDSVEGGPWNQRIRSNTDRIDRHEIPDDVIGVHDRLLRLASVGQMIGSGILGPRAPDGPS